MRSAPSGPPGASLLWPLSALVRRRTMAMRAARDQLAVGRLRAGGAATASSGPSFSMPNDGIDSTELRGRGIRRVSGFTHGRNLLTAHHMTQYDLHALGAHHVSAVAPHESTHAQRQACSGMQCCVELTVSTTCARTASADKRFDFARHLRLLPVGGSAALCTAPVASTAMCAGSPPPGMLSHVVLTGPPTMLSRVCLNACLKDMLLGILRRMGQQASASLHELACSAAAFASAEWRQL